MAEIGGKQKGKRSCVVKGCTSNEEQDKLLQPLHYYCFPSDLIEWKRERRRKWIETIIKHNNLSDDWVPKKYNVICNAHFAGGSKSEHPLHPGYNPTIMPGQPKGKIVRANKAAARFKRCMQRSLSKNPIDTTRRFKSKPKSSLKNESILEPQFIKVENNFSPTCNSLPSKKLSQNLEGQVDLPHRDLEAEFNPNFISCDSEVKDDVNIAETQVNSCNDQYILSDNNVNTIKCEENYEYIGDNDFMEQDIQNNHQNYSKSPKPRNADTNCTCVCCKPVLNPHQKMKDPLDHNQIIYKPYLKEKGERKTYNKEEKTNKKDEKAKEREKEKAKAKAKEEERDELLIESIPMRSVEFHGISSVNTNNKMIEIGGISYAIFSQILEKLPRIGCILISNPNQLLIFLMILKQGTNSTATSVFFQLTKTEISLVFTEILRNLSVSLECHLTWINKKATNLIPEVLKDKYPNCKFIIDSIEIPIEVPENERERNEFYSTYRDCTSFKLLIAYAPNGLILHVSKCYGSKKSDELILNDSGFLDFIEPNKVIFADKEFPNYKTVIENKSAKFLSLADPNNFLSNSVYIHIKQCVHRIKLFKILSSLPIEYLPFIDKIVKVCCCLTNMKIQAQSIVKKHKII